MLSMLFCYSCQLQRLYSDWHSALAEWFPCLWTVDWWWNLYKSRNNLIFTNRSVKKNSNGKIKQWGNWNQVGLDWSFGLRRIFLFNKVDRKIRLIQGSVRPLKTSCGDQELPEKRFSAKPETLEQVWQQIWLKKRLLVHPPISPRCFSLKMIMWPGRSPWKPSS